MTCAALYCKTTLGRCSVIKAFSTFDHKHIQCWSPDWWPVHMREYLSLRCRLFPTHFLGRCFFDRLGFLLGGGWDGYLQFSLCSSLLSQQLWMDVGQDSTCCDSHAFQQLRQGDKVKKLDFTWSDTAWKVRNRFRNMLNALENSFQWYYISFFVNRLQNEWCVQQLTWFNSSSLAMASRMCRGVTRPFLLSLAALPANSKISATWVKRNISGVHQ